VDRILLNISVYYPYISVYYPYISVYYPYISVYYPYISVYYLYARNEIIKDPSPFWKGIYENQIFTFKCTGLRNT